MDTELYQILSLALLGLVVLVLLAVLAALGRIRRTLARLPSAAGQPPQEGRPEEAAGPEEAGREEEAEADAELSPGTLAATTPEPDEAPAPGGLGAADFGAAPGAQGAPEAEKASPFGTSEPRPVVEPEPQPAAETPAEPWEEEEERFAAQYRPPEAKEPAESEPVATGFGVGEPAEGTAGTGGTATGALDDVTEPEQAPAEQEPQDQPFERDGKWFFRRGDELLTYEESTGQWVAADQPQTSSSHAAAPEPSATTTSEIGAVAGSETDPAGGAEDLGELAPEAASTTAGGFWKCPSCGAVNGSTATTCRMCFTARP